MIFGYGIITVIYCITIGLLYYGNGKVTRPQLQKHNPKNRFSIIVVFRNESDNLPALLKSISALTYPKVHFEIIFVNDGSTDDSETCIEQQLSGTGITFKILQNKYQNGSPKKQAITSAVNRASFPWILTTDADCIVPAQWLDTLNAYINEQKPSCVVAPVDYQISKGLLHGYQQLDFWSLQGVTRGSAGLQQLLMGNGANFAYQKQSFYSVNGFEGNAHIASGDDTFLLEKFTEAFPDNIGYLNSERAIVQTFPVTSWRQLISQRTRWASKTSRQRAVSPKMVGGIVVLASLNVLVTPLLWIISTELLIPTVVLLFLKMGTDYLFLKRCAAFFGKPLRIPIFLMSFFINALLTALVFLFSLFSNYSWKQRSFKR